MEMNRSGGLFFSASTLACVLFCFTAILSAQQSDPFYTNLLEKAQKSFLAKNYEEAAREFEIAAFGLTGDKILRAKAYVYLSLSQYHLKDVKAAEKSLHEAAAIVGDEGFAKLEIYESAWPDLEKLMAFFNIVQAQNGPVPKEVEKPKQETDPKASANSPRKKPGEKTAERANPASNLPPAQKSEIKLDELRAGDIVPLELIDTPPAVLRRVPAIYPSYVGAKTIEGTVTVRALISEKGDVIRTEIIKGIKGAFGFDQAALRAVQQWRFEPASVKGIKVKVWIPIAVEFRKTRASPS